MASSIEAAGLNESAANNMQMQNFYGQNQEVYYSLSHILDAAIQRTYHQLMIMVDMFPGTPDKEKKIKIIAYACKTRQLFMRIYALVKFIRTAHINVSNILSFLDQQSFIFVDTADFLYNLAKVKLVNARLPSYSILTAVDVLTLGTYPRLPSCIKERILPPEKMSDEEKARTLETLNRIIQCRLALCELPQQLKNFKIENGCVRFSVRDEFEAKLTLISDDFRMPWRLLKLKILVKDANDPNRALVNKFQIHHIHNIVQMKLNENNRPLVDLYKSLHFFAHSLQLEVLLDQMRVLNSLTMDRFFKISEYLNWRRLTVKYWLDYSKTEYEFKFTVYVSENSDYLQTSHHPPLHWRDHKNIDTIFKNGELLIKTLVHQIIKFRSKKRLIEIQTAFDKIPYCRTTLIEEKPALKVQFFISKFQNEAVWISIDYYTGLVQVFFPHSTTNPTLRSSIETAFNGDLKKIDSALLNLRIWLLLKRCETLIKTHGFKCFDELPIMSISDNQLALVYSKLEKNRLFIELRKQEKIYIMVTIRTKEDVISQKEDLFWHESSDYFMNENSFSFNYYILNIAKCKFDGELDPKQPFLKLMSISHYKKNSIFVMRNTNNKNRIGSRQIEDENNPCILEFINMIYHIEERLPYLTLMGVLSKQNLVTQNIQMNPEMLQMLSLSLMSVPQTYEGALLTGEQAELERVSRELNSQLISFTIRQRGFKDYTNTLIPINLNSVMKQAVFGMNARLLFTVEFVLAHSRLFDLPETSEVTNKSEVDLDSVMEVETPAQNNLPVKANESQHSFMTYHSTLEAPSLESLYTSIRSEWISMCRMYALLKEISKVLRNTDNTKVSELSKQMRVKTMTLKKIVIRYGPNLAYTVQFQWSKEAKSYDIQLGVDSLTTARAGQVDAPFVNYHNLFLNEIRKYFAANQSVINLVQLLNYTCVSVFGLARLSNMPKFYQKAPFNPLQTHLNAIQPFCGFTLVICSLTHVRLIYYSKYCLDVHIKTNGLVSIRDGSFGLTDINSAMEELCPIQFLRAFLDMFLDENVQELLRRRASLVEDDNPDSPSAANNNAAAQQHQHQNPQSQQQYNQQQQQNSGPGSQQQHVFVPPTSPAVRTGAGNVPTPSPVHPSYFAPSPSSAAALASAPGSNAPPSVAQSPGGGGGGGGSSNTAGNTSSGALFGNFGSPAIPHSSPAPGSVGPIIPPNQQQGSNQQQSQSQQPHSQQPASHPHMIQSPSGFMSPATSAQQQNYSTQSPANFSELSLQSPIQSMSIKSPFVGPSPSTNIPSVPPPTSTMGGAPGGTSSSTAAATHYGRGGGDNNQENDHTATTTSSRARSSQQLSNLASVSTSSILYNYHQYKKCHSASIPIYLSEAGFLKIITCQPIQNSETSICPLECFLASYHLKRLLIKAFQNDPTNFQLKNAEANIYKTYHVEMQISNEITPNYNAFSISFSPNSSGAASGDLPVDKIQSYFATKILTPPFRSSAAMSFFNLISTHDAKMLKEFAQIMDYEMNPHMYKTPWRVKYCWTIPYSYLVKSEKPHLMQFYQTSQFGFLRKDKYYYFILNFINQQRPTFLNYNPTSPFNNQNSVANIMLLMCFDSASASFQYEICRTVPDNMVLKAYEHYLSNIVNSAKQKDNSLITIINELLYGLPPFLR